MIGAEQNEQLPTLADFQTRVSFEISMVFGLFETAVAVRRGAIESGEARRARLLSRYR